MKNQLANNKKEIRMLNNEMNPSHAEMATTWAQCEDLANAGFGTMDLDNTWTLEGKIIGGAIYTDVNGQGKEEIVVSVAHGNVWVAVHVPFALTPSVIKMFTEDYGNYDHIVTIKGVYQMDAFNRGGARVPQAKVELA